MIIEGMGMGTVENAEESPDLCVNCGKDKSFLAGNEYLCLNCFDALMVMKPEQLVRNIGKLMEDVRVIEGAYKGIKKLIKDTYGLNINPEKGK